MNLCGILCLQFMLRAYPANFPSFGHHNNRSKTNFDNVYNALVSSLAVKFQSCVFKYCACARACLCFLVCVCVTTAGQSSN